MISSLPPVAKAAERVRSGDLDPVDLVQFCLQRIDRLDPRIRAWVMVDAEDALRQARELTSRLGEPAATGMLAGVPIGVKDIIDVKGIPTKAGSPLRDHHVAAEDASLVQRLRDAGAILLGKTVTTQFACFDPAVTSNPWNPDRTPGGSSSGSAAATALSMCGAAVGTQTGGSIIRPASYCGVAGLMPTFGAISLQGVVPLSPRLDHAGPIARAVEDLVTLFLVLAEPVALAKSVDDLVRFWPESDEDPPRSRPPRDPDTAAAMWCRFNESDREPKNARLLEVDFLDQACAEIRDVTRAALDRIGLRTVSPATMPDSYHRVGTQHRVIMARDAATYHCDAFAQHPNAYERHIAGLIREGLSVRDADYERSVLGQQQFCRDLQPLFAEGAFALLPATNTLPPARTESTGDPRFNSPWSFAGIPTVTIPCGVTPEGLPCGLQLIGPPHSDLRLLAAAAWCERRLPWEGFRV